MSKNRNKFLQQPLAAAAAAASNEPLADCRDRVMTTLASERRMTHAALVSKALHDVLAAWVNRRIHALHTAKSEARPLEKVPAPIIVDSDDTRVGYIINTWVQAYGWKHYSVNVNCLVGECNVAIWRPRVGGDPGYVELPIDVEPSGPIDLLVISGSFPDKQALAAWGKRNAKMIVIHDWKEAEYPGFAQDRGEPTKPLAINIAEDRIEPRTALFATNADVLYDLVKLEASR